MSRAAPGEALLSGRVHAALAAEPGPSRSEGLALEPLAPISLNGMPEPLPIFQLAGRRERAVRLTKPAYALPGVRPIWSAFVELAPDLPLRRQIRVLEALVEDWAPERIAALPLLGPLLGITLSENNFTRTLEPLRRRTALAQGVSTGIVGSMAYALAQIFLLTTCLSWQLP